MGKSKPSADSLSIRVGQGLKHLRESQDVSPAAQAKRMGLEGEAELLRWEQGSEVPLITSVLLFLESLSLKLGDLEVAMGPEDDAFEDVAQEMERTTTSPHSRRRA